PLKTQALYGLAGDVVGALEPTSEADPAALLLQFLVGFGNAIGRTAHFTVEADRHHANEVVVLLGRTAKGRQGTSWGACAPSWPRQRRRGTTSACRAGCPPARGSSGRCVILSPNASASRSAGLRFAMRRWRRTRVSATSAC